MTILDGNDIIGNPFEYCWLWVVFLYLDMGVYTFINIYIYTYMNHTLTFGNGIVDVNALNTT